MELRRFRITASNATRFLQKSRNPVSSLDPELFQGNGCSNYFRELAIRFFLANMIFNTGIWIHKNKFWLLSSPDGIYIDNKTIIPVEIKTICSNKTRNDVILEYYGQIQLQIETVQSEKLLLIIYFRQKSMVDILYVHKDHFYLNGLIQRLEEKYFTHLPSVLFPSAAVEDIEILISLQSFKDQFVSDLKEKSDIEGTRIKPLFKKIKTTEFTKSKMKFNHLDEQKLDEYEKKTRELIEKKYGKKFQSILVNEKENFYKFKSEIVQSTLQELGSIFKVH